MRIECKHLLGKYVATQFVFDSITINKINNKKLL